MNIHQLDGIAVFLAVAEHQSFTAAAAALEVTPPAISQSIRQLEDRLGVRLLHRTARTVALTEAGQKFHARVAPAAREIEEASGDLESYRRGVGGRLRINAPHVAYEILLRPMLADFLATHSHVRAELSLNDGFVDIVSAGFDLGLRMGDAVHGDMVVAPLTATERFCIVASPAYAQRHGLPRSIAELALHNCVRYRFPASGAIYRWELETGNGPVAVEIDGSLTVSDGLSLGRAAVDGIGIVYTFERQVAAELAAGRLVPVLREHWPTLPGFHFYYPNRRHLPQQVRAFIDYCRLALEKCPLAGVPMEA